MKSYPSEPLSPEERELAQLIARAAPQGGPSPALDARVLAAAHAGLGRKPAVRRPPRWPVAMGLAASVVFAVGIAWQLRPLQTAQTLFTEVPTEVSTEAPSPAASSSEEFRKQAQISPESADSTSAPMAEPAAAAMADSPVTAAMPEQDAVMAPAPPPPPEIEQSQTREVRAQTERRARSERALEVRTAPQARVAEQYAPPAPPAPPAPVSMAAPVAAEESSSFFAPDPHPAADNAGVAVGNLRSGYPRAVPPAASEMMAAKSSTASAQEHGQERESASLDRVQVTGSRLKRTDLQVPVADDARLPVDEWLERVRTRYGLGDAGAAKKSLLLFVKDHPREAVPGDLEPLLEK